MTTGPDLTSVQRTTPHTDEPMTPARLAQISELPGLGHVPQIEQLLAESPLALSIHREAIRRDEFRAELLEEIEWLAAELADTIGQLETSAGIAEQAWARNRDLLAESARLRQQLALAADRERAVCAAWIAEHGDPADWSPQTRAPYRANVACALAGGAT